MSFAIIAEFPLGCYRGHGADGERDPLPSPARVHAALMNAAAQGPRAQVEPEGLGLTPGDRAALAWVESNPPDALHVPATAVNDRIVIAYRQEGMFRKQSFKVRQDRAAESVAVGGPIAWIWNDEPPAPVRDAITALCADVSHLGTAESPVRLRVGEAIATHSIDRGANRLAGGGIDVLVPRQGRGDELEAGYRAAVGRIPTAGADQCRTDETTQRSPVPRAALGTVRYVAANVPRQRVPWSNVVLLPVNEDVRAVERVAWCVALHRALVGLIGDGAPPLITGRYPPDARRPANRLAIQYVHGSLPVASPLDARGAFALLVPPYAEPEEIRILGRAIRGLSELRLSRSRIATISRDVRVRALPGHEFWQPVPAGHTRLWVTDPAAIPDSRRVRDPAWTLADAALLSLGLVWRDHLAEAGSGRSWYVRLAQAARDKGAAVLHARKLVGQDLHVYVHRIAEGTVVQPYRAVLSLGTFAGDRTIVAIGQSRHLGGGLLVPVDVPDEGSTASGGRP